jgi:2-oxoglutarate ferredoxin oxidoreductase subunit gamma
MKHELIFSGIGGQGVMSIGELLCSAAVKEGYVVTFSPSYGQEKRGGRTMCQIVISDEMGSPVISAAELMLVMDERSLRDYEAMIAPGGYLIVNSNMITIETNRQDVQVIKIPCNDLAKEIGNAKTANMVALGAAMKYFSFLGLSDVKLHLADIFTGGKSKLIAVNEKALDAGFNYQV